MDKKGVKYVDYARPIYKHWDKEGVVPPVGYKTWIDYLRRTDESRDD